MIEGDEASDAKLDGLVRQLVADTADKLGWDDAADGNSAHKTLGHDGKTS